MQNPHYIKIRDYIQKDLINFEDILIIFGFTKVSSGTEEFIIQIDDFSDESFVWLYNKPLHEQDIDTLRIIAEYIDDLMEDLDFIEKINSI